MTGRSAVSKFLRAQALPPPPIGWRTAAGTEECNHCGTLVCKGEPIYLRGDDAQCGPCADSEDNARIEHLELAEANEGFWD